MTPAPTPGAAITDCEYPPLASRATGQKGVPVATGDLVGLAEAVSS